MQLLVNAFCSSLSRASGSYSLIESMRKPWKWFVPCERELFRWATDDDGKLVVCPPSGGVILTCYMILVNDYSLSPVRRSYSTLKQHIYQAKAFVPCVGELFFEN